MWVKELIRKMGRKFLLVFLGMDFVTLVVSIRKTNNVLRYLIIAQDETAKAQNMETRILNLTVETQGKILKLLEETKSRVGAIERKLGIEDKPKGGYIS